MSSASIRPYLDTLRGWQGISASQSGSTIELTGNLPNHQHVAAVLAGKAVDMVKAGHGDALGNSFEQIVRTKAAELAEPKSAPGAPKPVHTQQFPIGPV